MNVQNSNIMIVDDDQSYAQTLKDSLIDIGEVETVYSEEEFRMVFSPYKFDLILLDLRLKTGKEGLSLLDDIIDEDPAAVVIVISGFGDIATAVEALHKGARTFLEKDKVSPDEIKVRAEHVLKESASERRIRQLEASQEMDEIVGDDPKIQDVRNLIKLVAQDGETTVLIRGETGTGKELVARAIHRIGIRSEGPFVAAALTDNPETISSELFGHEKGSFTGASSKHFGYFEQAHKGLLFLDEIGDLPPDIQLRLLRILDQKTFRRMGGKKDIQVDVQIVTATNRQIEEMIESGHFRADLYYRLKVFEIHLPPLRERKHDASLLAEYFLYHLQKKGRTPAKQFSKEAKDLIHNYKWPGNVRELKSSVESAALRCRLEGSQRVKKEHLEHLLILQDHRDLTGEENIYHVLAKQELSMIENALIKTGGKKTLAWELLGYPDRFAMLRRVKRLLEHYPQTAKQFPEVKRQYSASTKDDE